METNVKKPSKLRIVLMWLVMVGMICFWAIFWLWRHHGTVSTDDAAPNGFHSVASLFAGGFFLLAGVLGYLAATFTGGFTFNYRRPVWTEVKTKIYILNIMVTVALALGAGFLLSIFLQPILLARGLDAGLANMLPLMLMIGAVQLVQLWVLIWAPLEKRFIEKRLAALGVTPAQLQSAVLVGLSNPASGFAKRFAAIEEDMGALWVGPEQLIFWGDGEQFGIPREQIVEIERKADNRSTTVLGGIAHIILHVRVSGSAVRQIRLHMEGCWLMSQKRETMDTVAEAIAKWHAGAK